MSTRARPPATTDAPADEARDALAEESRRLEKLWDAYRAQEGELQAALAKIERLTGELAGRQEAALAVEKQLAAKDATIAGLEEEKARLETEVRELEGVREELKALDSYKERLATLESAYAAERERLAKLYLVYEELESELKALQAQQGAPAEGGS